MKKIITLALVAATTTIGLNAQNIYDATKFTSKDLNGTARFVGMGGAMGALGGDISTIGTNPAGIGDFRSNDASITFGYSSLETKSDFNGVSIKNDKNRFSVDNIGFVVSSKVGDHTPLRYVNFAFNYQRNKSLSKIMGMEGLVPKFKGGVVSQTYQATNQANWNFDEGYDVYDIDQAGRNIFNHNDIGWLTALGYKGQLFEAVTGGYVPFDIPSPYSTFYSKESGGVDQYDLNMSFNFNDRFYLGMTLGIYDVNYKKYSFYDESYSKDEGYALHSWNRIDGSGIDFKLGAIVRPFENSPFRVGLAIHTPTFYTLTHETRARLINEFIDKNGDFAEAIVDSRDYLRGEDISYEYRLNTPWKFNLSLGHTIGTKLALGAEYEYQDYSSMKFRYSDDIGGTMGLETRTAKEMLKGVSTLRLGLEYKFVPEFALRAGYNISTAAYKSDAWKELSLNSIQTDTDYANTKAISNYTLGFGYRGKNFYADLAYKFNTYKEDFYAFHDLENDGTRIYNALEKTDVTNNRHQVMMTLGVKF